MIVSFAGLECVLYRYLAKKKSRDVVECFNSKTGLVTQWLGYSSAPLFSHNHRGRATARVFRRCPAARRPAASQERRMTSHRCNSCCCCCNTLTITSQQSIQTNKKCRIDFDIEPRKIRIRHEDEAHSIRVTNQVAGRPPPSDYFLKLQPFNDDAAQRLRSI